MRVILLTSDYHISANIGVKSFLEDVNLKKNGIQVAGILLADQFSLKTNHLKRTAHYFRTTHFGFLSKNILTNIWKKIKIFLARYILRIREREYYAIDEMAKNHSIPFLKVSSINSEDAKKFIQAHKPDLLVSCFLLEIVKKDILGLTKQGGINVHPALIQQHRGTFSSFWAIARRWSKSGATVHYMTEKVDEGDVILQKHFFVYPSDTIHSINQKAAFLGGKLLVKALIKIKRGQARAYRLKKLGLLFSTPSNQEIKRFYAAGRSLISLKDFFRL